MRILKTQVVIVGGGAAGCYAALNLHRKGIETIVVCKGLVGKSGASLFAGNLVLSGRSLGNSDENARNTAEFLIKYHNQFLIDQHWAKRCGEWIASVYYPELEEAGLYFRRDDDGNVVTSPGKIRSIAANVQGNSGVPFMDVRRKQIIKAGIETIEETVVTALLRNPDGSVAGVFGLEILTGEYVVVLAQATILATGYSDRLHARSTGTREMSADGLAMAWRAGASMVNLEMQWWHTNDVADPPTWQRMQIYPNPMLGSEKSARMVNSAGEEFFDQQKDDPLAFGPYTVQLKALAKQVHTGKASYTGGYYAGFDHCAPGEVEAYTTYAKAYQQLGMDFPKSLIETAVTAHYRQGGIDVNTSTMASSVPGLYIAGGVGGHCNGLIALVTYDGKVVADGVAGNLARLREPALPEEQVAQERERLEQLLIGGAHDEAACSPGELKETVRTIMWDKAGVEKDARSLNEALEDLARLRRERMPRLRARSPVRAANYDWLDAIDSVNMIEAAELVVLSSLQREESRGPFMRRDFPDTDNENWLTANLLHKAGNGYCFAKRNYELPFFRPDFARANNLEVPW
ncbi:MAG: FAD-dependent oxidoreductase [Pseudolabrys sp.]